ncbi:MAG: hypothetical protein AB8B74_06510 [Crocinitomicaceae bacterium]
MNHKVIWKHQVFFYVLEILFLLFTFYCFIAGHYGFPSETIIYLTIIAIHCVFTVPFLISLSIIKKKIKVHKQIAKSILILHRILFIIYGISVIAQSFLIIDDIINPAHWAFG